MKRLWAIIAFGSGLCFSPHAIAKAYFADKTQMIQRAEAIVVVNITNLEVVAKKPESGWSYRQKASGKVEQTIKGVLSGQIEIYGMEDFICARCEYKTGRYLLFLDKGSAGFWHGANWQLGIRAISDDKVEWFQNDTSRFDMTNQPLSKAIIEIETALRKKTPSQAMQTDGATAPQSER